MLMAYNVGTRTDPDFYALEVMDAVLSGGKTGRLYKSLVEGAEIATSAGTTLSTGRYPGSFSIEVELLQGKDRAEAEKLVLAELAKVRDEPISDVELQRVQQMLLASDIFRREGVHDLADSIATGVIDNDLDFLKSHLPKIMAVTAADVQRVAKKYLDPEKRVVVWSVPGKGKGATESPSSGGGEPAPKPKAKRYRMQKPTTPANGSASAAPSLHDVKRVVLPNGLVLLLLENHRLPIVHASAHVNHVGLLEPAEKSGVAALTGSLLDEGTAKHTGPEIAELIENVGGALGMSESGGSVSVLSNDRHLGLELLLECLTQSNFPKDSFAREKRHILSSITDDEQQPDKRAGTGVQISRLWRPSLRPARNGHDQNRRTAGSRGLSAVLLAGLCAEQHGAGHCGRLR